ncbi:MAG: DUF2271 domain-containing protein [Pedobacter sp.]|nr:DUF2271 domain-containing protein [Pedobacter sp.]
MMMRSFSVTFVPAALSGLVAAPALAADLDIKVEVPKLNVAEYHKPYVAVWVEREDNSVAAQLAVWYDIKMKNNEGVKWLKDMRQWWRRGGNDLAMPIDGVSGATRAPGEETLSFSDGKSPLGKLPAGNYKLQIEAAREVGGRELVSVPFTWPPKKAETLSAKGSSELGAVSVQLKP